jgi:hypothetical protein
MAITERIARLQKENPNVGLADILPMAIAERDYSFLNYTPETHDNYFTLISRFGGDC